MNSKIVGSSRRWALACATSIAVVLAGAVAVASASSHRAPASRAGMSLGPLVESGTIHYCSDISSPPLEFYKNGTQPTGSDISIGNAIAAKLGVKPVWVNTAFAGIIPALQAGHCDAILSQLFDKPARRKVVNFVDYMYSSEAELVRAGNPLHISGISDLCGHSVAAETGTTITEYLSQASAKCKSSGKSAITVDTFLRDSDAIEQLSLGHVDAYGTTIESGAYDMSKRKGQFQFAGGAFGQILTGIATRKNDPQLHAAIASAFAQIKKDGTYKSIMTQWNLTADMLK